MAWLLMALRKSELTHSINDLSYQIIKLNRKRQKLASFMTAIGNGQITPSAISSISPSDEYFYKALEFMDASSAAADEIANQRCTEYSEIFSGKITQEQYYSNPAISAQYELYFDENKNLDTSTMYTKFYEQALKEYVANEIEPQIKELEDEIDTEKQNLELEKELEKAELDEINNALSQEISNSTVKI